MKKILAFIFACGIALPAWADDATHVVGNSPDAEYATIAAALAASDPGDLIVIEDGTYSENLVISAGESVTLQGNVDQHSAVKIKGRIKIADGGTAQIEYVDINAAGFNYGVQVNGRGIIQHGTIRNGQYGVLVNETGNAEVYDQVIKQANRDGVRVKPGGKLDVSYSWIRHNAKAGVRANTTTRLRITDSVLSSNRTGIYWINATHRNNDILRNKIKHHTTGIHLKNSVAYRSDNRFADNTTNLVED